MHNGIRPMARGWDDPPIPQVITFMAWGVLPSLALGAGHLDGDVEGRFASTFVGYKIEIDHFSPSFSSNFLAASRCSGVVSEYKRSCALDCFTIG